MRRSCEKKLPKFPSIYPTPGTAPAVSFNSAFPPVTVSSNPSPPQSLAFSGSVMDVSTIANASLIDPQQRLQQQQHYGASERGKMPGPTIYGTNGTEGTSHNRYIVTATSLNACPTAFESGKDLRLATTAANIGANASMAGPDPRMYGASRIPLQEYVKSADAWNSCQRQQQLGETHEMAAATTTRPHQSRKRKNPSTNPSTGERSSGGADNKDKRDKSASKTSGGKKEGTEKDPKLLEDQKTRRRAQIAKAARRHRQRQKDELEMLRKKVKQLKAQVEVLQNTESSEQIMEAKWKEEAKQQAEIRSRMDRENEFLRHTLVEQLKFSSKIRNMFESQPLLSMPPLDNFPVVHDMESSSKISVCGREQAQSALPVTGAQFPYFKQNISARSDIETSVGIFHERPSRLMESTISSHESRNIETQSADDTTTKASMPYQYVPQKYSLDKPVSGMQCNPIISNPSSASAKNEQLLHIRKSDLSPTALSTEDTKGNMGENGALYPQYYPSREPPNRRLCTMYDESKNGREHSDACIATTLC